MKARSAIGFEATTQEDLAIQADQESLPNFEQKFFVRASTLGTLPGKKIIDSIFRVRGELGAPHLPCLPELPERGYHATKLARTISCLEGLSADGTASGWRIRTGRATESERAEALFLSDINALADVLGQEKTSLKSPYKIQLLGPISLSASVYRSNGELLLSDYGARRDIVQSFCEGINRWLHVLAEATDDAPIVLQLDEPLLEKAMHGSIATSSGYKTYRNIPLHEVEQAYTLVQDELHHKISEFLLTAPTGISKTLDKMPDSFSLSLQNSDATLWEEIARLIEADKKLHLGIQNPRHYSSVIERARWFIKNWRMVGLPLASLTQVTVTETAPMTDISLDTATTVMHHMTEIARAISEEATDSY